MTVPRSPSPSPSPSLLSPLYGRSDDDSHNGKDKCSSTSPRRGRHRPLCPPPSFNDLGTGNTRPAYLFPLFLLINIVIMTERAIIAGATKEFSAFVSSVRDSPPLIRENPDAGIGLLQAAFILGYSVAIMISGHYVHKIRWKPLVLGGMCIWWLGILGSGNARQYGSFYVLLSSRMATGCSEAAFQVVAPPLIQDRGGRHAGLWLSFYLTGLPVGLAFGYVYGSWMAGSDRWGWEWAYYWMCIASLPLIGALIFVKDETNGGILGGAGEFADVDAVDGEGGGVGGGPRLGAHQPLIIATEEASDRAEGEGHAKHQEFTLLSEIKACLTSPVLVTLSLGWAAIIGVVASLGTFGAAFVLALELYDDERDAAYWFGITAALAGIVGTPLGGKLADLVVERYVGRAADGRARDVEGVDDSLRWPIVASMVCRVNALVAASLLFVFPTVVVYNAAFFLTFLFIGWTLLFMTQTAINLVAMLSVDRCHRPNALAFLMLTSHFLGDVPLPFILGLIKDKLAPSCTVGPSGEFVDQQGCEEEGSGVRQTLAIAYAWVLWSLIFIEAARRFARREIGKTRSEEVNSLRLLEESENEEGSTFQYYHSRFQPTQSNRKGKDDASSPLEEN